MDNKRMHFGWVLAAIGALAMCAVALMLVVGRPSASSQGSHAPKEEVIVSDRSQESPADGSPGASSAATSQEGSEPSQGGSAETQASPASGTTYSIPTDTEYASNVVLVNIPEGMSAEEVESLLEQTGAVGPVHVSEEDLASGVVAVDVAQGMQVEDAINAIREESPELSAQPNFYYHAMLGDESDLRELLEEPFDAQAEELEEAASDVPSDVEEETNASEPSNDGQAAEVVPEEQETEGQDVEAQEEVEPLAPEEEPAAEGSTADNPDGVDAEVPEAVPAEKGTEALMEALSAKTNDPFASQQWALASMRVYEAWSVARCEGKVAIAILDLYPDVNHTDLADNVAYYYDLYQNSNNVTSVMTHGTHVSGIASAVTDNAIGVAGVSYNAKLLVLNVTNSEGRCSSNDLCKAYARLMEMADEHNLRVINISLGFGVSSPDFSDDAFIAVVDKAYEEHDIVTVVAAANADSKNKVPFYAYPGDAERVVSVMNLRQDGDSVERSTTSNYNVPGQHDKNICAPGSFIYSTVLNNGYGNMSGTSMAAPQVSGVLALIFAANPNLTAAEAVSILYNTAADLGDPGWDEGYGYGEVDAYAAVLAANPLLGAEITVSPTSFSYTGEACVPSVTVTVDGKVLTEGEDYSVSFANNVNAGTATVTVVSETYGGSASSTFTIDPISLNATNVTLSATSFSYTGSAIKPTVKVTLGDKTLSNGTDYALSFKNNVAVGTATLTVTGKGNYKGAIERTFDITANPCVEYCAHVQNVGWQDWMSDGGLAGTSGRSLRLEAIRMRVPDDVGLSGSILYRTHIQNVGWETSWKSDGALSGTSGRSLRLEALQVKLTGKLAESYDVYYRVHAQNLGWLGWAKNGESSGTAGYSYRLEALQVVLVKKGGAAPGTTSRAFVAKMVGYRTHVQNVGWQGYVYDGSTSGTSGRSLRLEGINISLGSLGYSGSIRYRTHVQNIGWQGWKSDGAMSGTSGQSLRLEAIQIQLTGEMAQRYDIYYRVHSQNIGWMGWAKNGASAGTAGYSYRLEAIQIRLVPKGAAAPGSTSRCFVER